MRVCQTNKLPFSLCTSMKAGKSIISSYKIPIFAILLLDAKTLSFFFQFKALKVAHSYIFSIFIQARTSNSHLHLISNLNTKHNNIYKSNENMFKISIIEFLSLPVYRTTLDGLTRYAQEG